MKSKTIIALFSALIMSLFGGGMIAMAGEAFFKVEINPLIPIGGLAGLNIANLALFGAEHSILAMNFGFAPLPAPDQKENPAGLKVIGYWIPIADLQAPIPRPKDFANINNNVDATTIVGAFVPKAGKNFITLYNTMDTSEIAAEAVGELDGKSWETTYEGFFPAMDEDTVAFGRKLINTRGIFIRITVDGKRIVVGSEDFPAVLMEGKFTTGKQTADRRGFTFKMKSRNLGPAVFYNGPIQISGSTIPPTS